MRAAHDALRAAEQDDVEWQEDDMNDPALLDEMERLERGEETDTRAQASASNTSNIQQPRSAVAHSAGPSVSAVGGLNAQTVADDEEYVAQVTNLIQRRLRECHAAVMAAKTSGSPQLKQLAVIYSRLKEMKRQIEEEGSIVDEEDIPEVPSIEEAQPQRAPTQSVAKSTSSSHASPNAAQKPGNKVSTPTSTNGAVAQRQASARQSREMMDVDRDDYAYAVPMQGLEQDEESRPSPAKRIAPIMPAQPQLTEDEIRERKFGQLESVLLTQLEEMKKSAMEASAENKKVEALAIIHKRKLLLKDLELTRYARATKGVRPPAFHIEEIKTEKELLNDDVSALELEIGVLRIDGVSPASINDKILSCYVVADIPIPDPARPSSITTHTVSDSLDPSFKFTQKIRIERTKALLRVVQKKKIVFSIFKPKSWFLGSPTLIGRAEMKMAKLQEDAEIHEALEVMEERPGSKNVGGGTFHGGKLYASLRLRTPLVKKMVITEVHKTLVIDRHFIGQDGEEIDDISRSSSAASSASSLNYGAGAPYNNGTPTKSQLHTPSSTAKSSPSFHQPSNPDLTVSTVASLTSVAPSSKHPHDQEVDTDLSVSKAFAGEEDSYSDIPHSPHRPRSRNPPGSSGEMLIDETHEDSSMNIDDGRAPEDVRSSHDFSTPLTPSVVSHPPTSKTSSNTSNQPNTTSKPAEEEDPKADFDFNTAGWMTSHAVLEWRKAELGKEIAALKKEKKTPEVEEALDARDAILGDIEHKITILITLVQSGQLTPEEYVRRVNVKLKEEEELYGRLTSVNRTEEAALCRKRMQIMKDEIAGA